MSRNLMGRAVPDEMYRMANGVVSRGGKAFVCLPEGRGPGDCDNCDGYGHIILQRVTGGPFQSVPKGDGSATFINGDWYLVVNEQFNCPECLGSGRVQRRRSEPERKPVHF